MLVLSSVLVAHLGTEVAQMWAFMLQQHCGCVAGSACQHSPWGGCTAPCTHQQPHYLPAEKCCSTCAWKEAGWEQACPTPRGSWERLLLAFKQRLVNFLNAPVSN